ncbi:hypothetical protein B0J13DRAFT_143331 [Dactylonectria estremocensis]|uniref:Uncharacterized protein n=1 Tax=Dactylonectria estremocensis TaxID=1079267 RepID=A0A9P9DZP9_9HYPO|nr:hypothetical protein B0J13DRAFT_143331 [Dactylonectria estremocensis]
MTTGTVVPWTRAALAAAVSFIPLATAALSRTGQVGLFSDEDCKESVYVNKAVIGLDFCAVADSATPYSGEYKSFIVYEHPWCENGSLPYWNVFVDNSCHHLIDSWHVSDLTNLSYDDQYDDDDDDSGKCVSVPDAGYRSYAFVCDGFDLAWGVDRSGGNESTASKKPAKPTSNLSETSTQEPAESTLNSSTTSTATLTEALTTSSHTSEPDSSTQSAVSLSGSSSSTSHSTNPRPTSDATTISDLTTIPTTNSGSPKHMPNKIAGLGAAVVAGWLF